MGEHNLNTRKRLKTIEADLQPLQRKLDLKFDAVTNRKIELLLHERAKLEISAQLCHKPLRTLSKTPGTW
jgi:hypothetical protein